MPGAVMSGARSAQGPRDGAELALPARIFSLPSPLGCEDTQPREGTGERADVSTKLKNSSEAHLVPQSPAGSARAGAVLRPGRSAQRAHRAPIGIQLLSICTQSPDHHPAPLHPHPARLPLLRTGALPQSIPGGAARRAGRSFLPRNTFSVFGNHLLGSGRERSLNTRKNFAGLTTKPKADVSCV